MQVEQVQIKDSGKSQFEGIGKLKDYQLSLPIDENIIPVVQPVEYHFRKKNTISA